VVDMPLHSQSFEGLRIAVAEGFDSDVGGLLA
jgi:hypothetical protein